MSIKAEKTNHLIFRDCLAELIQSQLNRSNSAKSSTRRKRQKAKSSPPDVENLDSEKGGNELDDGDAGDFINLNEENAKNEKYLAEEIFNHLPSSVQDLSPSNSGNSGYGESLTWEECESISQLIPPEVSDTLEAYSLLDLPATLSATLPTYIKTATEPVKWRSTRTAACELCDRDWVPLTYHHLIPRSTHDKVLKRGLHQEQDLNRVAWLCVACHRFVHRVEPNDELAKHWDTVEKLKGRDDVQRFVDWVGTMKWKLDTRY